MKFTRTFTALILSMLTIYRDVLCQSVCEPAEEGQSYNIECSIPGSVATTVQWRDENGVYYCACVHVSPTCACLPGYNGTMTLVPVTGYYTNVFNINSPHRNQTGTTYICQKATSSDNPYVRCNLSVFVRAKNPTCQVQNPGPTSNTDLIITCQDDDIFPGAACLFNQKTNNSAPISLPETDSDVTIETGEKICTLRVAGTYLGRGEHQFSVFMYPNITDVSYGVKSGYTDFITIGDPSAEIRDCPTVSDVSSIKEGYMKEGTPATCTCTRTDQTYFPVDISWKDKNGGTVPEVSQQDQSATLTFTAARDQAFTCTVTNSLQWSKEVIYRPQVLLSPSIRTFKANSMISEVSVMINSEVQFSCEAEGRPSPRLSLYKEDHGSEERLASVDSGTLTFSKTVTCEDTGLYKCNAEASGSEASEGIKVYVLCALKLERATSQNKVYRGEVSDTLDIIVPVIGHPGPTYLHLAGEQNILDDGSYTVMFFDVESSSGIIYIKFYDVNDELFQKYSLNITSSQGSFVYSFEIRAGDEDDTEVNAGAVIGGVVTGLLVVNAVVVAVVCIYRKGLLKKCGKGEDTSDGTYMNTIPSEDKDLPYQNAHNVSGEENMASSHYETVTDDQATSATDIPRAETDTEQTGPYENTL